MILLIFRAKQNDLTLKDFMATIEATRKRVENFPDTNSIESDLARICNKKNLDLHGKLDKFMEPDQQTL